jgi:hypothetical protein
MVVQSGDLSPESRRIEPSAAEAGSTEASDENAAPLSALTRSIIAAGFALSGIAMHFHHRKRSCIHTVG